MKYENILVDRRGAVGLISLHRPQSLNALCDALMDELTHAIENFEADDAIGCMVLTGSAKAFAAGADIKEMAGKTYADVVRDNFITANWEAAARARKPIVAAVAGYALGGGCELAMMCDFILAADTAKFGQPEINLGVMPGAGGTQRLARFVGKSKAMEMCLTGRMMDAQEAERCGLVSRIVAADDLLEEALAVAEKIAEKSLPSVMLAKQCVNAAFETPLAQGVREERQAFHSLFAFDDKGEGMDAFIEKRQPKFSNK